MQRVESASSILGITLKVRVIGEKGHKRLECKKPKKEKKKEGEEEHDNLFLITDDGSQEDLSLTLMETNARDIGYYVASGVTKHMLNHKEWYERLEVVDASSTVTVGDNSKCVLKEKGAILIKMTNNSMRALHNVLYIPNQCKNLLLVSAMMKHKMKVEFDEAEVLLKDKTQGDKVIARGLEKNKLYRIVDLAGMAWDDESQLRHERLGHINYTSLSTLEKQGTMIGFQSIWKSNGVCEACMLGKQH